MLSINNKFFHHCVLHVAVPAIYSFQIGPSDQYILNYQYTKMQNAYVGQILKNLWSHIAGTKVIFIVLSLISFSSNKTEAKNPPTKKNVSTAK